MEDGKFYNDPLTHSSFLPQKSYEKLRPTLTLVIISYAILAVFHIYFWLIGHLNGSWILLYDGLDSEVPFTKIDFSYVNAIFMIFDYFFRFLIIIALYSYYKKQKKTPTKLGEKV